MVTARKADDGASCAGFSRRVGGCWLTEIEDTLLDGGVYWCVLLEEGKDGQGGLDTAVVALREAGEEGGDMGIARFIPALRRKGIGTGRRRTLEVSRQLDEPIDRMDLDEAHGRETFAAMEAGQADV